MLTKFSSDYYIGNMYVEPLLTNGNEKQDGQIAQSAYNEISKQLYGKTILEAPLVIKIDNQHIHLRPNQDTPSTTAQLPRKTLEELEISNPPELTEVFFLTKEAVERFDKIGFL